MITVNSSIVCVPQKTTTIQVEKNAIPDNVFGRNSATTVELHVSDQAKTLSAFFDSASLYIGKEHVEPFSGYVKGLVSTGSWINFEKYNNHLFDKAASMMVGQAKDQGIVVAQESVVAHLRAVNADIANLKFDDYDRCDKLGDNSVLSNLTPSDLDSITDLYITAKEEGLDLNALKSLATDVGRKRYYGDTLGEGDISPLDGISAKPILKKLKRPSSNSPSPELIRAMK